MAEQSAERKDDGGAPKTYSTDEARDQLGALILRAGFGNERIPLTYHGELRAALIGPRDLERLAALDDTSAAA